MKAKYCPCLGVKLFAVGRDDIGEDFGSVGPRTTGGSDEGTPAPIWMQPGRLLDFRGGSSYSQCLRVCFCCTTNQNLSVCFSSCQTLRTPYKWPPSGPTKVIWIPANSSRTRSGRDQSGCESQNDAPGIFPGGIGSHCARPRTPPKGSLSFRHFADICQHEFSLRSARKERGTARHPSVIQTLSGRSLPPKEEGMDKTDFMSLPE